jgi:hypothetical protein
MQSEPIITEIEREPLRFLVASRTNPNHRHLVDLEEHNYNGFCGCATFQYRMAPLIKEPGWKPGLSTQCHHIRLARYYFADKMIRAMAVVANGEKI